MANFLQSFLVPLSHCNGLIFIGNWIELELFRDLFYVYLSVFLCLPSSMCSCTWSVCVHLHVCSWRPDEGLTEKDRPTLCGGRGKHLPIGFRLITAMRRVTNRTSKPFKTFQSYQGAWLGKHCVQEKERCTVSLYITCSEARFAHVQSNAGQLSVTATRDQTWILRSQQQTFAGKEEEEGQGRMHI